MNAPLSPRRRRLRRTLLGLIALTLVTAGLGLFLQQRRRPVQYRPDEASADITSELASRLPPEAPRPRFTDVTQPAGLAAFRNFTGARSSEMPEDIGPGLAWGDFDNDGDDDLFLVGAGGTLGLPEAQRQPCALYENRGDGTFRLSAALPETRLMGCGAAWADYDADGFLDLAVSGYQALLLFHNEPAAGGGRRLVRDPRLGSPRGFWTGLAWGDYDGDRAPDLYVCGYIEYTVSEADRRTTSMQVGAKVPFTLNPASFPGGTNLLLHNNRDGTFTDVAARLRVQNPEGRSLGALWHDFDLDGWLDLYVANDISDNVLYRNRGGTFEDISHPALVADYRSAMGLAVGDYNRDGDDDLFVSHWVAQENALYDNTWADFNLRPRGATSGTPAQVAGPEPARVPAGQPGNYPLRFMDIADMKGLGQIALPYVGWGTEFVDLDGDGWLDLVVANGSTLEEDGPPPRRLQAQDTFLFWNRRGEHFHNLAPLHPGLREKHNSRGLAVADFDLDGDMDLVIADLGEGVRLFRNDMQTGHWLKIRLRSRNHAGRLAGFGDGSTAIARVAGVELRRSVSSASYLSQSSRTLHFGLGTATGVDQLEVRWQAGGTNVFARLEVDMAYEIVEGDPVPRRLPVPAPRGGLTISAHPATQVPDTPAPGSGRPDRGRVLEFWKRQRAAMDAMKVDKDNAKAIPLFRAALEIDPVHEDSLYYLATCLASQGDVDGALNALATLKRVNPQSQRAFAQWGTLRAMHASSPADLAAAEESLAGAHAINPEETGALLVLGEVALLRGDGRLADERFTAACRTNPRAAMGFFVRGYLAWQRGEAAAATRFLEETRAALGKEWQPRGATSEGDVKQKQHVELTPLRRFVDDWNGMPEPASAFAPLDAHLRRAAR